MSTRLPSPSVGLRSTARQLFSQPSVMASVSVVVLVATLGLSALPRSLELASREDLRQTLTQAETTRRHISAAQENVYRPRPGPEPLAQIQARGARFSDQEMSEGLRALVVDTNVVVESPQFAVLQLPGGPDRSGEPVFIDFRLQDDISELSEVTAGRLPTVAEPVTVQFECPPPEEEEEEEECPPVELPVFEVALTREMSESTRLSVGDQALLVPDRRDQSWEGVPARELDAIMAVLEVTGVIELADADLDVWFDDRKLHFPREVFLDLDNQWTESTALLSPDGYGDMLEAMGGAGPPWWRYEWRYFIDSEGVARSNLPEFSQEVGLLRLAHSASEPGSGAMVLSTRLPELVDEHLAQRAQTLRIMALTVAGIVATVSLAVLALGVLMTERQREQIVLTRDRGASAPQVATSRLYQALLMTLPPVVAAYAVTSAIFDDTTGATPYAIVLVLTAATIGALVIPILGLARMSLGALRSEDSWRRRGNPRRLVLELTLVFLAAAFVVLVRRRDPRATTDFDWLLVATPAVVGAAVGALTIRLAGPVGSGLAWLSARGRGAVSFLALRRSLRQSVATRIPLAVLVVCLATASLTVTTMRSIEIGQERGSWADVGADFVVSSPTGTPLSGALSPQAFGVDQLVYGATSTVRATLNQQRGAVTLWAVEAERHQLVFGGTPGDLGLGDLVAPTPTGELAAVASDTWANRLRPQVGQVITVTVGELVVPVEIVAVRASLPAITSSFIVVDKEGLETAIGAAVPPTHALIRGPRSLGAAVSELAADNGAVVASRYTELDRRIEDPMVKWSIQGMTAGWLIAAGVAALGIVAALALGSSRRRRDLGFLKTMGLENRGATAMTLIEHIPGVALATALGLVTGAATLVAIRPSLDLSVLTGERSTPITVDWVLLGVVFVLALALLTAAGVIFVLVNRRQDLGRALRVGDE